MKHGNYCHHHKRNSSVASLSASAAKNPEKIEKLQAFDKWRNEQTDLRPDLVINAIYVHLSHRKRGNFVIECSSVTGHWMIEKSLLQLTQFQRNLELAFPVEAGLTGKPRILPKLYVLPKCPKWILLKKEICRWYRYQIEKFMRLLLECSILVAKSRLVEEFLGTDHLTAEEGEEEMSGLRMRISAPMSDKSVLRCHLGNFNELDIKENHLITVIHEGDVYPLVNLKSLAELKQTMSFLYENQKMQFYIVKSNERILLADDETFKRECNNNQLLYMEFLHE